MEDEKQSSAVDQSILGRKSAGMDWALNIPSNPSTGKADEGPRFYCICHQKAKSYKGDAMVQCDDCKLWYHYDCVGITYEDAKCLPAYQCVSCLSPSENSSVASHDQERIPKDMVKIPISNLYCLAEAIQVVISNDTIEDGYEQVRKSIFAHCCHSIYIAMSSDFLRLNVTD